MSLLFTSCREKKEDVVSIKYDPELTPSMITDSVSTLISDSGVTRYKLVADIWEVFDKAKEPYWFFSKGIYLERFDDQFNIEATVEADTAWNFDKKRLWKLKGNVDIENMKGERFLSEEFYWDQRIRKVYSDKPIEIFLVDGRHLKGVGFESNQEMTEYRIRNPYDGRFPIRENELDEMPATDETQVKTSEPSSTPSTTPNNSRVRRPRTQSSNAPSVTRATPEQVENKLKKTK